MTLEICVKQIGAPLTVFTKLHYVSSSDTVKVFYLNLNTCIDVWKIPISIYLSYCTQGDSDGDVMYTVAQSTVINI